MSAARRGDLAAHRDGVVCRAGAAARPCRRASARPAARPGRRGCRDARPRRSAPRRRAPRRRARRTSVPSRRRASASSSTTSVPSSANSSLTARSRSASSCCAGLGRGLHDRALAHLDGERGDEAVDRPVAGRPRAARAAAWRRGSRRPRGRAARALRRPLPSWAGLWQSTSRSARWATSALLGERLAAHLRGQAARALGERVGAQQRPAPPARQRASHVAAADQTDLHEISNMIATPRGPDMAPQDWLKKPFSMSRARSSAEISTLRGVSMKTLSAIRCMPPSSA